MKVSVVKEQKVLRIDMEGYSLEIVNKTPVTSESERTIEAFFSNWKIIRGIPFVSAPAVMASPAQRVLEAHHAMNKQKKHREQTPYSFPVRVTRICEAFETKKSFCEKDVRDLNSTSMWTAYTDIHKMVRMNKLVRVDDGWKVVTPDHPSTVSDAERISRISNIRSDERVFKDGITI